MRGLPGLKELSSWEKISGRDIISCLFEGIQFHASYCIENDVRITIYRTVQYISVVILLRKTLENS